MTHSVDILLVEDNPDDVALTLTALRVHTLGNQIHVVRDGEEALDFVFCREQYAGRDIHQVPKIILLDLKLPKVDGLDVLRQIKADPRTQPIPVVVLTSSNEERDLVQSYALGVNSYIVKPMDFDQFIESARVLGMYWSLVNRPPVLYPANPGGAAS
jgi:two-component system response regulator